MSTIFLVDDHPVALAGTKAMLSDMTIVGEASNTPDAISGILDTRPDVALIDVQMEEPQSGAAVVAAVKEVAPDQACVAFTVSISRADVAALLAAGVDGYLTKSTTGEELRDALQEVSDGGRPISREVASYLLDIDDIAEQIRLVDRLTPREREVVMYIARGFTYRETSSRMGIKVKTLETHMTHIFEKLGVATRAELSFLAYETHIVDPTQPRE